jgi:hypothetical protein
MAKRTLHQVSPHASVETGRDWNGRYYIAFSSGASVFIRDLKELRRFLKLPKGIPSRDAFDAWLTELDATDAKRKAPTTPEGISPEVLATGFGPEAHLDESDPNYQTRTIT